MGDEEAPVEKPKGFLNINLDDFKTCARLPLALQKRIFEYEARKAAKEQEKLSRESKGKATFIELILGWLILKLFLDSRVSKVPTIMQKRTLKRAEGAESTPKTMLSQIEIQPVNTEVAQASGAQKKDSYIDLNEISPIKMVSSSNIEIAEGENLQENPQENAAENPQENAAENEQENPQENAQENAQENMRDVSSIDFSALDDKLRKLNPAYFERQQNKNETAGNANVSEFNMSDLLKIKNIKITENQEAQKNDLIELSDSLHAISNKEKSRIENESEKVVEALEKSIQNIVTASNQIVQNLTPQEEEVLMNAAENLVQDLNNQKENVEALSHSFLNFSYAELVEDTESIELIQDISASVLDSIEEIEKKVKGVVDVLQECSNKITSLSAQKLNNTLIKSGNEVAETYSLFGGVLTDAVNGGNPEEMAMVVQEVCDKSKEVLRDSKNLQADVEELAYKTNVREEMETSIATFSFLNDPSFVRKFEMNWSELEEAWNNLRANEEEKVAEHQEVLNASKEQAVLSMEQAKTQLSNELGEKSAPLQEVLEAETSSILSDPGFRLFD